MTSEVRTHLVAAREYKIIAEEQAGVDNLSACKNYLLAAKEFNEALETCRDPDLAKSLEVNVTYCRTQADRYKPRDNNVLKQGGEEGLRQDFSTEIPKVTYNNVAGMHDLKSQIMKRVVYPIKHAGVYKELVRRMHNGIILYGPGGCGKTFISKATAGELNKILGGKLTYMKVNINDITKHYVGVSEQNLDNVFKQAAENSPTLLFFDEIDALGGSRSEANTQSHDRKLLNQFLASFERLEDKLVLVVGATNRPWGIDFALLRSGRFGDVIRVDPPDKEARKELFKLELLDYRRKWCAANLDLEKLADETQYMSCSDISNICYEAAMSTMERFDKNPSIPQKIEQDDLLKKIKQQKRSLYTFVDQTKGPIDRGEIPPCFADLENLVVEIEEFRNKTNHLTPKKVDEGIPVTG